MMYVPS